MSSIRRILLHPIKSLDAQEVAGAEVLPSGALEHDRAYALLDADAQFVNGKRNAAVHLLRSNLDLATGRLSLTDESDRRLGTAHFALDSERRALLDWFGTFFGFPVTLAEDRVMGFPDDPDSPGPTVIGTSSLEEIGRWFELPVEEVRARFRTNIEIDDVPPFWEDRLFGVSGKTIDFSMGAVRFKGTNPCQRCAVPPRNPWTGAVDKTFAKRFAALRQGTLPAWTPRDRFDHFYRAAVNTRIEDWQPGSTIRVGDAIEIV